MNTPGCCSGSVGNVHLQDFEDVCVVFHSHGDAPARGSSCRSQPAGSTAASLYQPASHAHGEWKGPRNWGRATHGCLCLGGGAQLSSLGLLCVTLCSVKWGFFMATKLGTLFLPLCARGDTEAPLVGEEQGREQALRRFSCNSRGVLSWDLPQVQFCSVLLSVQGSVSAWQSQLAAEPLGGVRSSSSLARWEKTPWACLVHTLGNLCGCFVINSD